MPHPWNQNLSVRPGTHFPYLAQLNEWGCWWVSLLSTNIGVYSASRDQRQRVKEQIGAVGNKARPGLGLPKGAEQVGGTRDLHAPQASPPPLHNSLRERPFFLLSWEDWRSLRPTTPTTSIYAIYSAFPPINTSFFFWRSNWLYSMIHDSGSIPSSK